jgi:hypothetical protein
LNAKKEMEDVLAKTAEGFMILITGARKNGGDWSEGVA